MALVARASKVVRRKNLLMIALCLLFTGWFAYDGYVGYPDANDRYIGRLLNVELPQARIDAELAPDLENWSRNGGWRKASPEARRRMDDLVKSPRNRSDHSNWKSPGDVRLQQSLVWVLLALTAAAVAWFFHAQRRRATADDSAVSPRNGLFIPWDRITQIDNRRWKSAGIVEITYLDPQDRPRTARFDDYLLEREPLLEILELQAQKAVKAEVLPRDEPEPTNAPA
jgi:hypothetical protein